MSTKPLVHPPLLSHLLASGQSAAEVAARAKTPVSHLYNILAGIRSPKRALALALQDASRGVLRAGVLMGIEPHDGPSSGLAA